MNQDGLRELLDRGVPAPPPELMSPPLAVIRRRAYRRRLATGAGAAAMLLVITGVVVQVAQAARTPVPSTPPPPAPLAPPTAPAGDRWLFAVVGLDDRSLTVFRAGASTSGTCATESPPVSPPGQVRVEPGRVVLPLPVLQPKKHCVFRLPVRLDVPLGTRGVIHGGDGSVIPVLRERIVPRPTYPSPGLEVDPVRDNVVSESPGHWAVTYQRADGYLIMISASRAHPVLVMPPPEFQARFEAHGRDMWILRQKAVGGVGRPWDFVTWTEEGWNLTLRVTPGWKGPLTHEELHRVVDGLVWP